MKSFRIFYQKSIIPPNQNSKDWKTIYDVTPCYIFSFSNEGFLTRINATFLQDLGFEEQEVLGVKKMEDLLTVGSKIFFQTHFYPLIKIQKKASEIFLSFLTKEKTDIPMLLNVILYEDETGNFEIHCGGMQISRRNRFEKELLEDKRNAQKALNENVELIEIRKQLQSTQLELERQLRNLSEKKASQAEISKILSHDLQEPLRKISLYSSKLILLKDSELSQNSVEILKKITGFAEKVRRLLDSLEKFNSLDERKLENEPIHFSDIESASKSYAKSISDNIEILFIDKIFTDDSIIEFCSDPKLLKNLFKGLIQHAVYFKNEKTEILKIKITTDLVRENIFAEIKGKYQYQDCIRITFENNIKSNFHLNANAFELFKRAGTTNEDLGIGLAYCRRIVQILNGKITVSSKNNTSTNFYIILPLSHQ